jgi:large subunit ribosomal protein L31
MQKKTLHPEWFSLTKVFCDGELIMLTSSTKSQLDVDIWSGKHPFYTGSLQVLDIEGRVERFKNKYKMS